MSQAPTAQSTADPSAPPGVIPADDEWLIVIDPQAIFASPDSPWASPMWAQTVPHIAALITAYQERVVLTRFVADPQIGGSWAAYYDDFAFALVPDSDPLYAVVPELAPLLQHAPVVTAGTFGKWNDELRAIVGAQPRLALCGVATDCCVLSTALPAADAGALIRVITSGCAGSSPTNHQQALSAMALYAPQITLV